MLSVDDAFTINEEPLPLPPGVAPLDPASEIRKLFVRCAKLESRMEGERRSSQEWQRQLLLSLLEVADGLDRMVHHLSGQGVAMQQYTRNTEVTGKQLAQKLKAAGVVPMDLLGTVVDPTSADVEDCDENPQLPDETVTQEVVRGYWWNDAVLRRGKVIVSRRPER